MTLRLIKGALAGTIATVPMPIAMALMQRTLPTPEQYPLPPKEITVGLTEKAGVRSGLGEAELNALTIVAHYGYGALGGGIYALAESKFTRRPAVRA